MGAIYWIMIQIGSNVQIELCNFHLANWIWLMHTQTVHSGFDWIGLMSDASLWETISEGEKWMLSVMLLGALWGSSPRPSDFIMAKIFLLPQYGQGDLTKKIETWTKDYHSIRPNTYTMNRQWYGREKYLGKIPGPESFQLLWGHFAWKDPSSFNLHVLRGLSLDKMPPQKLERPPGVEVFPIGLSL